MKFLKVLAMALCAYVALVIVFETYLGIAQPRFASTVPGNRYATILLTTAAKDGSRQSRVVQPMLTDGHLYVSANHWPRSWYNRVLENQEVEVTDNGQTKDYLAVLISPTSEENDRLEREHPHPAWFRFLTGYPPRRFVRLDPR